MAQLNRIVFRDGSAPGWTLSPFLHPLAFVVYGAVLALGVGFIGSRLDRRGRR